MRDVIQSLIEMTLARSNAAGKCGRGILQPQLAEALATAGFRVDVEDSQQLLKSQMPVWRSKDSGNVELTLSRRRIDIVAYDDRQPIALIEVESDLDDLQENGVSGRSGHYDVASIAGSTQGLHFDSYKSLERMAAAAFYFYLRQRDKKYPDVGYALECLEALRSDLPADHNPTGLMLFLASGRCRAVDRRILEPRLKSLDASLICAG